MKLLFHVAVFAIAVCTFMARSETANADNLGRPSTESIVTCGSAGTHLVLSQSVAEGINTDRCKTWSSTSDPDPCAPCITSLEGQGCRVGDVVATNTATPNETGVQLESVVTYLLSCTPP